MNMKKANLPRTSTFYGNSYIPADLIVNICCANCNEECSIHDDDFLLFRKDTWDIPLCLECSEYAREDKNFVHDIFLEECVACGGEHIEGECEATNGKMD